MDNTDSTRILSLILNVSLNLQNIFTKYFSARISIFEFLFRISVYGEEYFFHIGENVCEYKLYKLIIFNILNYWKVSVFCIFKKYLYRIILRINHLPMHRNGIQVAMIRYRFIIYNFPRRKYLSIMIEIAIARPRRIN